MEGGAGKILDFLKLWRLTCMNHNFFSIPIPGADPGGWIGWLAPPPPFTSSFMQHSIVTLFAPVWFTMGSHPISHLPCKLISGSAPAYTVSHDIVLYRTIYWLLAGVCLCCSLVIMAQWLPTCGPSASPTGTACYGRFHWGWTQCHLCWPWSKQL